MGEQDFDAKELLNEHGKDISGLSEKISKSYSFERYEDFQDAVKKIILEVIDGSGRDKIKSYAKESFSEHEEEKKRKKKDFWVPNWIQIVIGSIALAGLLVALFKQ